MATIDKVFKAAIDMQASDVHVAPGEPFVVWGSGAQGRAFVHTRDIVDALVATLPRGLGEGVIQIGPDACSSIRQVAETIVEVSGKDIEIRYDTSKPEGDRGRCADYSKARRILGWEPRIDLRTGLQECYQWIKLQLERQDSGH